MYLYIMLGGYLRILGAHSVQSCCTLPTSASYRVFLQTDIVNQVLFCVVVGHDFVSTSSAFMSSVGHPVGPHDRISQRTINRVLFLGARGFKII